MHDAVGALADLTIRRACGFAGLAIGTVMLSLSFDLPLALRTGGVLMALVCVVQLALAWRAPRRNMRRSELWTMLPGTPAAAALHLPPPEAQTLLAGVLRDRLLWHAERIGLGAVALWVLGLLLGAATASLRG